MTLAQSPVPASLRALTLSDESKPAERPKFDPYVSQRSSIPRTIDTWQSFADESVGEVTLSRRRESSFLSRPVRDQVSDIETEKLSRGMALLLSARDRTLTLSEQRVRRTHIVISCP